MSEILTKLEYENKEDSLTKSVIEFAMATKEFEDTGCYKKEFIKVGDEEVTLLVMDNNWVALHKDVYYDLMGRKEYREEMKSKDREYHKNKKFLMGLY